MRHIFVVLHSKGTLMHNTHLLCNIPVAGHSLHLTFCRCQECQSLQSNPLWCCSRWLVLGTYCNFIFWWLTPTKWLVNDYNLFEIGIKHLMRRFYKLSVLWNNSCYLLLSNISAHELLKYYVKLCILFWNCLLVAEKCTDSSSAKAPSFLPLGHLGLWSIAIISISLSLCLSTLLVNTLSHQCIRRERW